MEPLNELDEAQLRHEFRQTYKDLGYVGSLRVVYELITAATIFMDIIIEERSNGNDQSFPE